MLDESRKDTCLQAEKSQPIRLLDVVFVGPLMIYGATKMPRGLGALALGFLGVTTIAYNARNYARVKQITG